MYLSSSAPVFPFTRLTSFVVKSFCKAKSTGLVDVDTDLVCRSVDWIASRQERDGSFIDDGCLHHKAMMVSCSMNRSDSIFLLALLITTEPSLWIVLVALGGNYFSLLRRTYWSCEHLC